MKKNEILKLSEENNLRLIRFLYCDLAGVIRGKTVHASQLPAKITEGVGLTRAQNAVNLFERAKPPSRSTLAIPTRPMRTRFYGTEPTPMILK